MSLTRLVEVEQVETVLEQLELLEERCGARSEQKEPLQ
jgi:hypothetical protein